MQATNKIIENTHCRIKLVGECTAGIRLDETNVHEKNILY